jgi:hypothetical protein
MKGSPSREPTPFEKFTAALKGAMAVPKATIEAREAELRADRSRARKKKPAAAS